MTTYNIRDLDPRRFAIIDPETGTIIGTQAVIVELPHSDEDYDAMLESENTISEFAEKYGAPLLAYDSDLTSAHSN